MSNQVERFRRLIESLVAAGRPFAATVESPGVMQVERAADVLMGRVAAAPIAATVVDASGHRRPVYRPLLAYAAGATHSSVEPIEFTAANGAQAAAAAWWALANDDAATVLRIVDQQRPNGAFLRTTSSDNPEVHWYHELVVLHAVADHAVRTGNAATVAAVERACAFHLEETETDHATGQPWGLPAFVRVAGAEPLAGAVLHAVPAHQPNGPSGVALFLLADTLYGLARNGGGWGPAEDRRNHPVTTTTTNTVPADLLNILRCPITGSRLRQEGDFLVGEVGGMAFPVRDGFPVMLPDEAKLPAGVASLEAFKAQFGGGRSA